MASRKKTFNILVVIGAAFLGICIYFFIPSYFGDEVYPLKYENLIVKYSNQFGVDPALVAGVILQESRFNPKAQSSAGAQGLMQFMPGTAKTMANELGVPRYNIYDPETDIMFGTAHLRDLLNKYNGDVDAALAGYNAGTGNADRWVRLGILGNIPFGETRNYVKKIKNYQSVYTNMYAEQLGLKQAVKVEQVNKNAETARVRGFIWSQIFSNIFSFR